MYNNLPPPPGPQQWAVPPHANGALAPGPAPPPPAPAQHFPPPDQHMQHHPNGMFKDQLYTPHTPMPPHAGVSGPQLTPDAAVAPWNIEAPGLPPPPPPPDEGMGQVLCLVPLLHIRAHTRFAGRVLAKCHPTSKLLTGDNPCMHWLFAVFVYLTF